VYWAGGHFPDSVLIPQETFVTLITDSPALFLTSEESLSDERFVAEMSVLDQRISDSDEFRYAIEFALLRHGQEIARYIVSAWGYAWICYPSYTNKLISELGEDQAATLCLALLKISTLSDKKFSRQSMEFILHASASAIVDFLAEKVRSGNEVDAWRVQCLLDFIRYHAKYKIIPTAIETTPGSHTHGYCSLLGLRFDDQGASMDLGRSRLYQSFFGKYDGCLAAVESYLPISGPQVSKA
jgi:hypothetical protein